MMWGSSSCSSKIKTVDHCACREHAQRNFRKERMIDEYISAYKMALQKDLETEA
jgi:hypothetical protein